MFGAKRSHPAKLARRVPLEAHPAVRAALATTLPSSVDLSTYQPQILDQGQSGACTWGSSSSAIAMAFASAGKPLGWIPSQFTGYAATRAVERAAAVAPGQPLPSLTDGGAELADVFHVYATFGARPMLTTSTPDGRFFDLWTSAEAANANVNNEPDLMDLEAAGTRIIVGPYAVDPNSPNATQILQAALAAKIPVQVATFVDTAFMSLPPGAIAGAPNTADPQGGGHALFLHGYETLSSGEVVFHGTNDWGTGWSSGGRFLAGPSFMSTCWEFWPVAVVTGVS